MYNQRNVQRAGLSILFLILLLFAGTAVPAVANGLSSLVIEQADGEQHHFQVELALTNSQRQKGLMYRTELPPEQGMLFIFPKMSVRSFWMRNTYIPLDIIFLNSDGVIVNIVENAEPETDTPRPSKGPAKAVLEIAGGRAAELGLAVGGTVRHALLGNMKK